MARGDPMYDLGNFKQSRWNRNAEVGIGGKVKPAAKGIAIDRGDGRFLQFLMPKEVPYGDLWHAESYLSTGQAFFDVHAGAEGVACSCENGDARPRVLSKSLPAFSQSYHQIAAPCVAPLRTIHGDNDDRSSLFVFDDCHRFLLMTG